MKTNEYNHDMTRKYCLVAGFTYLELGYTLTNVAVGLNQCAGWIMNMETQPFNPMDAPQMKSFGLYFACFAFFAFIGSFLADTATHSWGKKKTIMHGDGIFFFGICMCLVQQPLFFLFGRSIMGLGLGINMVATPGYINALVPETSRGKAGAFMMICFSFGAFCEYLTGYADPYHTIAGSWRSVNGWRMAIGMWLLWPFARVILLYKYWVHPCPDDLIARDKRDKAQIVINACHVENGEERYRSLMTAYDKSITNPDKYKDLWTNHFRVMLVATMIAFAWNFTGFPYLLSWTQMLYNVSLYPWTGEYYYHFAQYNYDLAQNYCVLFGGVMLVAAFITYFLIDIIGRRGVIAIGLFVDFAMMMVVCILGYVNSNGVKPSGNLDSMGTVACYSIWAAGFGIFNVGAFTWLLDALPKKGWNVFMGSFFIITFFLQLTAWDVFWGSYTTLNNNVMNGTNIMGLFCCIATGILYIPIIVLMKETKKKTHAKIREMFGGESAGEPTERDTFKQI